jgi:DNA-binding CsgD family transcriptional regulator|tara:strand:- start:2018 stop:2224 length:207 start_codon:yes stop_codon:yes gene_type:complete
MVSPETKLTARELQVVKLIVKGMRYKEIAQSLGLSYETVKTYVGRIRKKLNVSSKTEVAMWAIRNGIE